MSAPPESRDLKKIALVAAGGLVLVLPTVISFFAGGFFADARILGLVASWFAFLVVAIAAPQPLPRDRSGRLLLGGLVLLALLTAFGLGRTPAEASGVDDLQRLLLYLPYTAVAVATLGSARLQRWTSPGLLTGIVVVCCYGLAGRLVPALISQTTNPQADGRLDQPVTYWNAMGIIAAMGIILAAYLVADRTRGERLSPDAAATLPWLAATLALTVSRGAIAATVTGLLILIITLRSACALRSAVLAAAIGITAALATFPLQALRDPTAAMSSRTSQGLLLTAVLVALTVAAILIQRRLRRLAAGELQIPALRLLIAATLVTVLGGFILAFGSATTTQSVAVRSTGGNPSRLASAQSNRGAYWAVALKSFGENPVLGKGPASFRVEWLRERPFPEAARDAHSLYIETAAELGGLGLIALLLAFAGVIFAAMKAIARHRAAAAGPAAVLAAWALHAGLDWDWEMPAVTLIALACAGYLCALANRPEADREA